MDGFVFFEILVGALLGAIGAWGFAHSWRNARRAVESATWPAVEGEVVELAIRRTEGRGNSGTSSSFTPIVRYMYRHGERWITGDALSFAASAPANRDDAEDVLARYAGLHRIPVRVSPHDPEVTVLESGTSAWHGVQTAICGLLALSGGWMVLDALLASPAGGEIDPINVQIGFGGVLTAASLWAVRYFYRAAADPLTTWRTVPGVVTGAEVREFVYRYEPLETTERAWRPVVRYRYERDGQHVESVAVKFQTTDRATSPEAARDVVLKYHAGQTVPVYLSRSSQEATLEPEAPQTGMISVGAFLILAVIGIVVIVDALSRTP